MVRCLFLTLLLISPSEANEYKELVRLRRDYVNLCVHYTYLQNEMDLVLDGLPIIGHKLYLRDAEVKHLFSDLMALNKQVESMQIDIEDINAELMEMEIKTQNLE